MEDMYYIPDAGLYIFVTAFIITAVGLFLFGIWRGYKRS